MSKNKKLNPAAQIAIGFFSVIAVGTLLLCLPISSQNGQWLPFIDGLFTSTSAVCVTGLVVVDTAVHFSLFGQIVILVLIQIGGLGFITITALFFFLIGKRITLSERITIQESLNQENLQGIVKLVRNIIILVFATEFAGFAMLLPSFVGLYGWGDGIFKALFTSISAFCNAGFDNIGVIGSEFASIATFANKPLILIPIMLLVITGGIGFIVVFDIGKKFKGKALSFHSKVVLIITAILVFGGALIFGLLEWNNPETIGNLSVFDKIVNCLFQSVTPRTAGFATFDTSKLSQGSILITDILMFIGGNPASTAGGVKTTTILILLVTIFKRENAQGNISFCKRKINTKMIKKSLRVVFSAIGLLVISTFLVCAFEGGAVNISQAIFETISAISTVGLSLGITPLLCTGSKIVLAILMFAGRVGVITLSLALANRKPSINQDIEYPDSKLMIG